MVFPAILARLGGEWASYPESVVILTVLSLAGIGTGVLFFVSVVAYRRRQNRRYALITVAVAALFFRSIVGLGTVLGIVPMVIHHLLAHGFDFAIAALILSAVYQSGPDRAVSGVE
ncbi:MAG: hypothetical protein V5A36_08785 [Natronomonas sp.]